MFISLLSSNVREVGDAVLVCNGQSITTIIFYHLFYEIFKPVYIPSIK